MWHSRDVGFRVRATCTLAGQPGQVAGWGEVDMLMTDLAVRDLEGRRESFMGSVRRLLVAIFGRSSDHGLPDELVHRETPVLRPVPPPDQPARAHVQAIKHVPQTRQSASPALRWQRHPQLRASRASRPVFDTRQRSARLEAERAMLLARSGKLAEAEEAFTTAARDLEIDLGALPGFWDLPRSAMMTAVRAYEHADRLRDAAALEARIRHLLRPRPLKPVRPARRPDQLTASGD